MREGVSEGLLCGLDPALARRRERQHVGWNEGVRHGLGARGAALPELRRRGEIEVDVSEVAALGYDGAQALERADGRSHFKGAKFHGVSPGSVNL